MTMTSSKKFKFGDFPPLLQAMLQTTSGLKFVVVADAELSWDETTGKVKSASQMPRFKYRDILKRFYTDLGLKLPDWDDVQWTDAAAALKKVC